MNGYECITQSIEFFEKGLIAALSGELSGNSFFSAAALAEKSGYSLWHFTRLFTFVTGFTPKNYISARIFTECASTILRTDTPLSVIANAAGFADYTTFSRSFKRWSKITPAALRKIASLDCISAFLQQPVTGIHKTVLATSVLPTQDRSNSSDKNYKEILANSSLEAELIDCAPMHLTGLSFYLNKEINSFNTLWELFTQKERYVLGRILPEQYCQYTAWTPSPDGCNRNDGMMVMCGLATNPHMTQLPIFVTRTIPGGYFLHVTHRLPISEIGETYRKIYIDFFANTDIPLQLGWEYQSYCDGKTNIYIPITCP